MAIQTASEQLLPHPPAPSRPAPRAISWDTARIAVTIALITGLAGVAATIGADSRWLAALGRIIVHRGAIPVGIPFAANSTAHWANALVLAELIFDGLEAAFGDKGLVLAQIVAVAGGLTILARDARNQNAPSTGVCSALALAAIGSITSLAIVRVQLFSLILFPALIALLRSQARQPSNRIWWALPLLALWANLHGAVLSGLMVLYAYLAFGRLRRDPKTAIAVAILALPALCCTPALLHTVDYFHGLITNVAAQRGVGMWAPLGNAPADWITVGAAVALVWRLRRHRPALWETVVLLVLAGLTVKAARDGVWLLFVLVAPAAHTRVPKKSWNGLVPIAAVLAAILLVLAITGRGAQTGASSEMVARAIRLAHGSPVLADALPAEQVAIAGGRIWAGDPLDAFSHRLQATYLDWIAGAPGGRDALNDPRVKVVLVFRNTAAQAFTQADHQFREVASDATSLLFLRRR